MNPFAVVKQFEQAICEYTGAPNAVCVNSCTAALFLCCKLLRVKTVHLPKRTYVSVPMSVLHAGGKVHWTDHEWEGKYQLWPYPIWDCARLFTSKMYQAGTFMCVSFHASKTLGIEQGGAILHSAPPATDRYLRRLRFDGRTEGVAVKDDNIRDLGYHCYMSPSVAAQGLLKIYSLPKHNEPIPNDQYPDLSLMECFR